MPNARVPMIYSEQVKGHKRHGAWQSRAHSSVVPMQLKEMVSAIRNIDAHSPPPLDRPDEE